VVLDAQALEPLLPGFVFGLFLDGVAFPFFPANHTETHAVNLNKPFLCLGKLPSGWFSAGKIIIKPA